MVKLSISYDPYRMKTAVLIDGEDVSKNPHHKEIETFIKNQVPLQTWISKQEHNTWEGLLSHLIGEDDSDELCIHFFGRKLDFEDLKRTLEAQNASRDPDCRVTLTFREENLEFTPDDQEMMRRIDEVVKEMHTDKFNAIVDEIGTDEVKAVRDNLRAAYATAKNEEFQIVFAGIYSSGKSTIINTLMRHMVLPMADDTSTTRVTRIYHNNEYGSCVKVVCKNNSGSEICSKLFDNDEDCMSYIDSLPVSDDPDAPDSIDHLCLYVDLSHLYPETNRKEMMTRFKLVLVDTPGSNSAVSTTMVDGKYHNQHKEIALRAIRGGKEIVILCASYNTYESEDMGKLLQEIHRSSREKNGGFNDRFLFVINQCDNLNDFDLRSPKESFANYLRNPIKLQVPDTYLNPRIFLTTAKIQEFIQRGVPGYSEDERETDSKKDNEYDVYNRFRKQVIRHNHWLLAQHCDLPEYRKAEMQAKFNKAKAEKRVEDAVSIQTGIPCLEVAIQDYLERYAYPLKIRDLLYSFESCLTAIGNMVNLYEVKLEKLTNQSTQNESDKNRQESEKAKTSDEQSHLTKLLSQIEAQKAKIEAINPSSELAHFRREFDLKYEGYSVVNTIRRSNSSIRRAEGDQLMDELSEVMEQLKEETYIQYNNSENDMLNKIGKIIDELTHIAKETTCDEEIARLLGSTPSGAALTDPTNLLNQLREDTESTLIKKKEKHTGYDLLSSLFAGIKNLFGFRVKTEYYDISVLKQSLALFKKEYTEKLFACENDITNKLEGYKKAAEKMLDKLKASLKAVDTKLTNYDSKLQELSDNKERLEKEHQRISELKAYLEKLTYSINAVHHQR